MRMFIVGVIFLTLTSLKTSADEGPSLDTGTRGPNYQLKHVTEVSWDVIAYNNSRDVSIECNLSTVNINNSVQFVVNQSARLKFITFSDRIHHYPKSENYPLSKDGVLLAQKYFQMPELVIMVDAFDVNGTCVADVSITVNVFLESSKIVGTDYVIQFPRYPVWRDNGFIRSPPTEFGHYASEICDDRVKKFINDWTASQTLP
jgi:hypothetical protein